MNPKHKEKLISAQQWIQQELNMCIDFWLSNGIDTKYGGVYTCLDRKGEIYSTDKNVWQQGRCAWIFSYLCHIYGVKKEWLDAAKNCLDFMEKYCINHEAGGRMYFTVTADGKPLRQRRYWFSEGFYAISNAEYYGITKEDKYLNRAKAAYELIWKLYNGLVDDPTGMGPKTIPETRSGRGLAAPMFYLMISNIFRRLDPENGELYNERANICANNIVKYHFKPELKCTLEFVALDGTPQLDYTDGRLVNPGQDIESSIFLMELANLQNDTALHEIAETMFLNAIDAGWDKEYGGLLYFIDCLGKPTEAYEHDMKLWWTHNVTMIASLMAYRDTGKEEFIDWFFKTLDYSKEHFADSEYGEWYGYLRRDGLPTMPSTKGSSFKGPFHLPRMLCMTDQIISSLLNQEN